MQGENLLDNYGKPRKLYYDRIGEMSEDQLYDECKKMIWLSAYANNNPRSDYHWKCDGCCDESEKRHDKKDSTEKTIYSKAYDQVLKDNR